MYRMDIEIDKRERSSCWSEEIARKVLSAKSRRTKMKITVTGSLFMVFLLFFFIGFDFSGTVSSSPSWSETIISSVNETMYPQLIPQEVEEFISYSFNGQ